MEPMLHDQNVVMYCVSPWSKTRFKIASFQLVVQHKKVHGVTRADRATELNKRDALVKLLASVAEMLILPTAFGPMGCCGPAIPWGPCFLLWTKPLHY